MLLFHYLRLGPQDKAPRSKNRFRISGPEGFEGFQVAEQRKVEILAGNESVDIESRGKVLFRQSVERKRIQPRLEKVDILALELHSGRSSMPTELFEQFLARFESVDQMKIRDAPSTPVGVTVFYRKDDRRPVK